MSAFLRNTGVTDDERGLVSPNSAGSGNGHRDLDVSEKMRKVNELQQFLRAEEDKIESAEANGIGNRKNSQNPYDNQYYDGYYGNYAEGDDYNDGDENLDGNDLDTDVNESLQPSAVNSRKSSTLKPKNENLLLEDFDSANALKARSVENVSKSADPYEGQLKSKESGMLASIVSGIRNTLFGKKVDPIEVNDVNTRPVRTNAFEEKEKTPTCFKACF